MDEVADARGLPKDGGGEEAETACGDRSAARAALTADAPVADSTRMDALNCRSSSAANWRATSAAEAAEAAKRFAGEPCSGVADTKLDSYIEIEAAGAAAAEAR